MENANNQSLMSLLQPPEGAEALALFFNAAGNATGCRTDADLARLMGVPPTALANWKRRGKVSQQAAIWFQRELIPSVALVSPHTPNPSNTNANAALIDLIVSTGGDPLGCRSSADAKFANALALPGLIALSMLIVDLAILHRSAPAVDIGAPELTEFLREAVAQFRTAQVFQGFTR